MPNAWDKLAADRRLMPEEVEEGARRLFAGAFNEARWEEQSPFTQEGIRIAVRNLWAVCNMPRTIESVLVFMSWMGDPLKEPSDANLEATAPEPDA